MEGAAQREIKRQCGLREKELNTYLQRLRKERKANAKNNAIKTVGTALHS